MYMYIFIQVLTGNINMHIYNITTDEEWLSLGVGIVDEVRLSWNLYSIIDIWRAAIHEDIILRSIGSSLLISSIMLFCVK